MESKSAIDLYFSLQTRKSFELLRQHIDYSESPGCTRQGMPAMKRQMLLRCRSNGVRVWLFRNVSAIINCYVG